jgi:hypothetical protein
MNMLAFHHPDADPFLPACINVPGVFNCHLCVCGVEAAGVLVVKALLAPDKNFP